MVNINDKTVLRQEKSCGAVVYYLQRGKRLYLLEEMRTGHFAMPKGHMEPGETEAETAEREILEETGLRVRVDTGFRAETEYAPRAGTVKQVVYFTARAGSMSTTVQLRELRSICWLPYKAALQKISYENDREVLRAAEQYLKEVLKNS